MVNHVKTLLLNLGSGDIAGMKGSFYIDSSFTPVKLTGYVKTAHERLYSGCSSIEDRLYRLYGLCSLIDRVDLKDRLSIYDQRVTDCPVDPEQTDLLALDVLSLFSGTRDSTLFEKTGYSDLDQELLELTKLRAAEADGHLVLCSKILALVAQLEAARRRENG